ncbi:dentin sialophosphoprotein-like [Branchiostoma lanceolatum]|uniref:dentin sialophosphoprotein-like n=1 Tax=Branchiostoma lanceolatum TaxID=7740 RepID=UPI003455FFED
MDDSPRPTGSSSTAREEERLEKVLREGTFRDSLVLAKVIDTHPSSDSDSDESTPVSSRARCDVSTTNRPQCQPKDNSDKLQQRSAEEPSFLGSGDASSEDKLKMSAKDKSEGDATAGDRCTEDTVRQDKQKSNRGLDVSESEAATSGEATTMKKDSQDAKAEKAGVSKEGSSPSSGDRESSVGSSSESGSDSDQNRSNDGANSASTDDRNQVFITIETPLFVRSHYVYLPKKKKTEAGDKDDSGDGPSSSSPDDPSAGKKEEAGPSKRKYSSDSESEPEGKSPGTNKRQKTESEDTQRDSSAVSQDLVRDSAKEENIDDKKGRSETKKENKEDVINRPSGEISMEKQKEKESPKAASLKRPLDEDDREESPKRRRQSFGPDAGPTVQDDAACKESETPMSDRTEKPQSGEGDETSLRPTPQDGGNTGDQVSPSPRRRRSFTERYYEDAPILPAPPAPVPPAAAPTTETGDSAAGVSKTESAAPTSDTATSTTSTSTNGTSEKKTPSPLGPPWNMYDPRNPESSSIRGTKKERYNLRIAQAMVDNAINTVLQELGFSPGSSRRKRRRRRERERQQAMEEAGVSSAIRSQGLSMGGHHGGRTTTTSPGCPHHRRTSELNAGAGPSSASLPVPENEDEFERLAVSEAISQAGLSKSEEPKDGSKDKDSSA